MQGLAAAKAAPRATRRRLHVALVVSFRMKQWTKNLFVLAPVGFAGIVSVAGVERAFLAFAAFCAAASGLYLCNDVADRDADRLHPRKRFRPIASGELPVPIALVAGATLMIVAIGLGLAASRITAGLVIVYIVVTLAYSWRLKHVEILDVLLIASGFVLRVAAGSYAVDATPSKYLLLCTMFLALFLGFGKRRHELITMGDAANGHRPVLSMYTERLLDEYLGASMIGALLSYSLYTFFSDAALRHEALPLTIPFAVYGLLRYQLLVHTRGEGGSPEELLLVDRPLQLTIALWAVVGAAIVQWSRIF